MTSGSWARAPFPFAAAAQRWALALALAGVSVCASASEHDAVDALIQSRGFDEALSRADRFLAANPRDVQMRFLKGVIQTETNRHKEAIATFTQLTREAPELPEPHNNLAVLYAGQGQYDRARVALEAALQTHPSYATAQENLGDVYARLASNAYAKALQMEPGNSAAPKLAVIRSLFPGHDAPAAAAAPASPPAPRPEAAARMAPARTGGPAPTPEMPASAVAPAAKATPAPASVAVAAPPSAKAVPAATPARTVPTDAPAAPAGREASGAAVNAQADVERAVQAWAEAWAAQDMKRYLATYAASFVPAGGESRSAWEAERGRRITGKSGISVAVDQLDVRVNGDKAVARFRQSYRADTLNVRSRKTLELARHDGAWRITREAVGGR